MSTLLFNSRRKQPLRLLHPLSALALIVGIVIGAGIFKTPSLVAGMSGDAGWALVLWVAGALISIALLAFVFCDCMSTLLNLGAYSSAIWRSG